VIPLPSLMLRVPPVSAVVWLPVVWMVAAGWTARWTAAVVATVHGRWSASAILGGPIAIVVMSVMSDPTPASIVAVTPTTMVVAVLVSPPLTCCLNYFYVFRTIPDFK